MPSYPSVYCTFKKKSKNLLAPYNSVHHKPQPAVQYVLITMTSSSLFLLFLHFSSSWSFNFLSQPKSQPPFHSLNSSPLKWKHSLDHPLSLPTLLATCLVRPILLPQSHFFCPITTAAIAVVVASCQLLQFQHLPLALLLLLLPLQKMLAASCYGVLQALESPRFAKP